MTRADAAKMGGYAKNDNLPTANLQLAEEGKMFISDAADLLNVSPRMVFVKQKRGLFDVSYMGVSKTQLL